MEDLNFIEGALPKGFKTDFEPFLFNEAAHLSLQSESDWHTFSLVKNEKKSILASVSFFVENKVAVSPLRAPFGSFQFSEELSPKHLYEFIQQTEAALKMKGVNKVVITNPPLGYSPLDALLMTFLVNQGYTISKAEVGAIIDVNKISYERRIESWEVRKLKQAKDAGLSFKEIPVSMIEGVYGLIAACRHERQQALSMSAEEIVLTVGKFPGRFILFGVFKKKELIAASIAIKVSGNILYNFYSAHLRQYDKLSPVVLLMQGMYQYCKKHSIEKLDLGTSAIEGQPNFGLLDFKMRLDGKPSPKLTFRKDLI